jgi:hypothetical protein
MRSSRTVRSATHLVTTAALCSALALPALGGAAQARGADIPSVHLGLFAAAPAGATHPDDITRLGDLLYVTYQNNAAADGSPAGATSTVVAFDRATGAVVTTYTLTGRCDGLTADPRHHRIFATVNEDLNSSLSVITPGSAEPLAHFDYSPSPAETGSDGTNGGTDAVAIGKDGTVYVAHSNPDRSLPAPNDTAAVYTLELHGTTAELTPLFGVNDSAAVINPAAGGPASAPLGLTDPDSNRFLPGPGGGTLIQDSQADSKLVFATDLDAKTPTLLQLGLTNATPPSGGAATPQLDDIERAGGPGTLYAVDQATGNIYETDTAQVEPGTLFVSQPAPKSGDLPNDPALGVLDPHTGVVTHVDSTMGSPKGLLFVPEHGRGSDGK